MKKFFKIFGISVLVLIALLVILPIVFKGKIVEQVKIAINENVDAKVDFGSFRLSFIRSFPDVSFRLNDLRVLGVDEFEGDTLASVKSFFVSVNLKSIFGSDGFEIKTIRIDQPRLFLKVLEDGTANWDIARESDHLVTDELEKDAAQEVDFKLALRRFQINNAHIVYDDREMQLLARMLNFNHTLTGDFTADFTSLAIRNTSIESLYVNYEGIPFLNEVFAELTADIDANLKDFEFTFRDNSFRMNDLLLAFEGTFAMPEDQMIMDFTFSSPQTAFKSFLSLVPAIYAQEFEELETEGSLAFNGFVRGILDDDNIPGFNVTIGVENGMFRFPDLPAAVTDVHIATHIHNPGGDPDLTEIDISRFSLNLGNNPVDMRLNVKTPVSDPQIDAFLSGRIDLSGVNEFFPLDEGETMAGIIESDMEARGRLSSIENELYEEFLFEGSLHIASLSYSSEAFPQGVEISEARMLFSPQFATVPVFGMKTGSSDLSANGRIDNIIGFALNGEMLAGSFQTFSSFFDLNQLMEGEAEEQPDPDEPFELSVIEVPANIDFTLQSRFDKIVFGDLEITHVVGSILVKDQAIRMNDLRMDMLGGNLLLNGSYATHDVTAPEINFGLQISDFDVTETFSTFNTFALIAPVGERTSGNFSAGLTLRSVLDEKLEPVMASLAGGGNFSSAALAIENSPALVGLAENLRMDMFRTLNVRDLSIDFEFRDGRVEVKPFTMNMGRSSATMSGNHGFDQSINYLMSLEIPRDEFGGAANQILDNLIGQAANRGLDITPSETVRVGVAFTGTVSEPNIRLTLTENADDARQQMMDVIEENIQQVIDEVREQAEEIMDDAREQVAEELERRAQQIVAEAQRQATNIRNEAQNTADAIRKEAREQAKNLEDEASGPLAKAAARRAGEELIRNADQRADRLEREADQRATQLVDEANQRADRIRAGEEE